MSWLGRLVRCRLERELDAELNDYAGATLLLIGISIGGARIDPAKVLREG
jgi:hypothetical protein